MISQSPPNGRSDEAGLFFALECVSESVLIANRDGHIEYRNPAALAVFGDSAMLRVGTERAQAFGLFGMGGPDPIAADRLPLARALAGERVYCEHVWIRSEAVPEARPFFVSAFPRLDGDGQVEGAVLIFREAAPGSSHKVDGQRPWPEAFRRLEAAFTHALDAVLLADDEMRYVDVNQSACALLGYMPEELLKMRVSDILPPEHRDAATAQWSAFMQAGRAEGEMSLVRRDGRTIHVEYRAVARILPSLHLSILRDVTDRKRTEAALRETQRTESLGVLAGAAAHDFNNLLVGIIGNASLGLEREALDGHMRSLLRDILTAGERASLLSRQMLTYAGKSPAGRETLNLTELVREIGPLLQGVIPKQVEVRYELVDDLPTIEADPAQVQQVVMNLLINAGQAMFEQSPGKIHVRTAARELPDGSAREAEDLRPGSYIALEVEDTGRGMDTETVERIFEPFFTTKVKGKGLGLATVRGIVRDHGGTIWVRSAPGDGTCFTVVFPVAQAGLEPEATDLNADTAPRYARILVVDDEPLVQRMVKSTLEGAGYYVEVLADARDAVSLLASPHPPFDAVLLDLGLRGVAPRQLARDLRNLHPNLNIIPFSGQPESELRDLLTDIRTAGFIQKPFTAAQLRQTVRQAIC